MTSKVLSVRVDSELLDRLQDHAARRQVTVQDYVLSLLVRDDFDERFTSAVEETERFYAGGASDEAPAPHHSHLGQRGEDPARRRAHPDRGNWPGPVGGGVGTPLFASPYPAPGASWFGTSDAGDGLGRRSGDAS